MTDLSETFNEMNQEKKERHVQWKVANMKTIDESGIPYKKVSSESIIFRETGKPKVDFYPSTGRWRVPGQPKTYSGGGIGFINWYKKL